MEDKSTTVIDDKLENQYTQAKVFEDTTQELADSLFHISKILDGKGEYEINTVDELTQKIDELIAPKIVELEEDSNNLKALKSDTRDSIKSLCDNLKQNNNKALTETEKNDISASIVNKSLKLYNSNQLKEPRQSDKIAEKLQAIETAETRNAETTETRYDETLGNEEWLKSHDMLPDNNIETDLVVVDKEHLKDTANEIVEKLENYNNKVIGLEPLKLDLNSIDATPENFAQRVEEIFVNVDIDKMNVINDFLKSVERDVLDKSPFQDINDDLNYDVAYDLNECIANVRDVLESEYVAENSQERETATPIKNLDSVEDKPKTNNQEQEKVQTPELTVNNQYANVINSIGEIDNIASDTDKVMIRVDVVNELLNILKDKDTDSHKSLETVANQITNLENTLKSALTELESIKENLPLIENSPQVKETVENTVTAPKVETETINKPIDETISSINNIKEEVAEIKQQYVIDVTDIVNNFKNFGVKALDDVNKLFNAENRLEKASEKLDKQIEKLDTLRAEKEEKLAVKQEKLEKVQETSKKVEKIRGGKPSLIGKIKKNKKVIADKSADVTKDDLTKKLDKNAR